MKLSWVRRTSPRTSAREVDKLVKGASATSSAVKRKKPAKSE